jgi:hypothetical protein
MHAVQRAKERQVLQDATFGQHGCLLFYSKPAKPSWVTTGNMSDKVCDLFIHLGLIFGVK